MPNRVSDEQRDLQRLFRVLLLLYVGLCLVAVGIALTDHSLPDELQDYAARSTRIEFDRTFFAVIGGAALLTVVLLVGLWFFQRWARYLFSLSVAASLLLPWFRRAPDIRSASTSLGRDLVAMSTGAVLVFIWGVLRKEFGGRDASRRDSPGGARPTP